MNYVRVFEHKSRYYVPFESMPNRLAVEYTNSTPAVG